MKEEIRKHQEEPHQDVEQRRTTERGRDPGTSEPGVPPRTHEEDRQTERSPRIGPPGTTQVDEKLHAVPEEEAPTEDSPAREPTERIERMENAAMEAERRRSGEETP